MRFAVMLSLLVFAVVCDAAHIKSVKRRSTSEDTKCGVTTPSAGFPWLASVGKCIGARVGANHVITSVGCCDNKNCKVQLPLAGKKGSRPSEFDVEYIKPIGTLLLVKIHSRIPLSGNQDRIPVCFGQLNELNGKLDLITLNEKKLNYYSMELPSKKEVSHSNLQKIFRIADKCPPIGAPVTTRKQRQVWTLDGVVTDCHGSQITVALVYPYKQKIKEHINRK